MYTNRPIALILIFLGVISFGFYLLPSSAYAKPKKPKPIKKGRYFLGGKPPVLEGTYVVGQKKNEETGKYVYLYKVIVQRAGKEEDGSLELFKAKDYGTALVKLLDIQPASHNLFNTFFPVSLDKTPFPPVLLEYYYLIHVQEIGGASRGWSDGLVDRENKGKRMFREFLSQELEPGAYEVTVEAAIEIGNHEIMEMYDLLGWFQLIFDIPGAITGKISEYTEWFTITGFTKKLLLKLITNAAKSTAPSWKLIVKAKVPKLKGMKPSAAVAELWAHSLGYKTENTRKCKRKERNKVIGQSPAAGKRVLKNKKVTLEICRKKSSAPPAKVDFYARWNCPGNGFIKIRTKEGPNGPEIVPGDISLPWEEDDFGSYNRGDRWFSQYTGYIHSGTIDGRNATLGMSDKRYHNWKLAFTLARSGKEFNGTFEKYPRYGEQILLESGPLTCTR